MAGLNQDLMRALMAYNQAAQTVGLSSAPQMQQMQQMQHPHFLPHLSHLAMMPTMPGHIPGLPGMPSSANPHLLASSWTQQVAAYTRSGGGPRKDRIGPEETLPAPGEDELKVFFAKCPIDARCLDFLVTRAAPVQALTVADFVPRNPTETDFSAAITNFARSVEKRLEVRGVDITPLPLPSSPWLESERHRLSELVIKPVCSFWAKGTCRNGAECKFLHPEKASEELVAKVKAMQKTDLDAADQWTAYADTMGTGTRDPAKYEAEFVQMFIDQYNLGIRMETIKAPTPETVNMVKSMCKINNDIKEEWITYCKTEGKGSLDPCKHLEGFLQKFINEHKDKCSYIPEFVPSRRNKGEGKGKKEPYVVPPPLTPIVVPPPAQPLGAITAGGDWGKGADSWSGDTWSGDSWSGDSWSDGSGSWGKAKGKGSGSEKGGPYDWNNALQTF